MAAFVASGVFLRGGRVHRQLQGVRNGSARVAIVMASSSPVVLCPGQGAQYPGMARAWRERSPAAAKVLQEADAILGNRLGSTLSEIILEGPKERLDRTDAAQPAIFVTSIAAWEGMKELELVPPETPAAAAGLSLGEYTALVLGGAMSFEDGLKLVALRGLAMQEASEATPSTMCALVGADEEKTSQSIAYGLEKFPRQVLVAANYNAPGQVVLSGNSDACKAAAEFASTRLKLRAVMLDVAGAFHSPIMAPAADRLGEALAKTAISAPQCPVMANVTGEPHGADAEGIREKLVAQLTNATRWADCMSFLSSNPQVTGDGPWIELAPGKTLSGIMRKCDRSTRVVVYDTPPDS